MRECDKVVGERMIQTEKSYYKGAFFKLTCVLAVAVLILGTPLSGEGNVPAQHARNDATRIPPVATILGIRVGFDTVEKLERRLGRGTKIVGGHPHGGRIWTSRKSGNSILVDGFYYNDQGRVIDQITISGGEGAEEKGVPLISIPAKEMSLFGTVSLGLSKGNVLKRIRKFVPHPQVKSDQLKWHSSGLSHVNGELTFKDWTVELSFTHGRLDEISISSL